MRMLPFLLAIALLPHSASAEVSPLSAEIGTQGISATRDRLAALEARLPPELFALAGLEFLAAVEGALQARWRAGVTAEWSELPVLRLPIPDNPAPEPFSGAVIAGLLTEVEAGMAASRAALARLGTQDFALEIAVSDLWFDIDMNGRRDPGEDVAEVAGLLLGARDAAMVEVAEPVVRFDTADAAWLSAYARLLSGIALLVQAFDPAPAIDRVLEGMQGMEALRGESEFGSWDRMFGQQLDRIVMLLAIFEQAPDPALTRAARDHLLVALAENRRFWDLVLAERDNDREWIPNEAQASGLGILLPPGTIAAWQAVLQDTERLLKGERLIPHWRYGAGVGINLARWLEDPAPLDLAGTIQGGSLLPWAEPGVVVSDEAWSGFSRLMRGNGLLFAVFFN